ISGHYSIGNAIYIFCTILDTLIHHSRRGKLNNRPRIINRRLISNLTTTRRTYPSRRRSSSIPAAITAAFVTALNLMQSTPSSLKLPFIEKFPAGKS
ncbi:hypothetical protein NVV30_27360, partial [Pseudomonas syringae]|uniref:hypothetical protein n=1 Tax=Pseudomonas syringae TaxID=317 RepID=UPI00215A8811